MELILFQSASGTRSTCNRPVRELEWKLARYGRCWTGHPSEERSMLTTSSSDRIIRDWTSSFPVQTDNANIKIISTASSKEDQLWSLVIHELFHNTTVPTRTSQQQKRTLLSKQEPFEIGIKTVK